MTWKMILLLQVRKLHTNLVTNPLSHNEVTNHPKTFCYFLLNTILTKIHTFYNSKIMSRDKMVVAHVGCAHKVREVQGQMY